MTDSKEKEGEYYDVEKNIPGRETAHGIYCTKPEMATHWVVWASIGCHTGGGCDHKPQTPIP